MPSHAVKLANSEKSLPAEAKGFLVKLKIHLIGGGEVWAVDAFRAATEQEAANMAINVFLTGKGMIMFGDTAIVLDAVAAIKIEDKEFINLEDPFNKRWLESVEVFERFLEEQQYAKQEEHRPRTAVTPFRDE